MNLLLIYILYIIVFARKIKKKSGIYLERVIKYIREDVNEKPVKSVKTPSNKIISDKKNLDIEIINHIGSILEITELK